MIDRQYCTRYRPAIPTQFPVSPRTDFAALHATVVDRRDDRELLCDGSHDGPHCWPDGEEVERSAVTEQPV